MESIIGHEDLLRELRSLAASNDPPHALLFAGPEGTGRSTLALEYARLLNCETLHGGLSVPAPAGMFDDEVMPHAASPEGGPCRTCRACRLISDGTHPDVIRLGPGDALCRPRSSDSGHARHPDSRDIRICQVRGLIELAAKFPYEARTRVILVDPAERMNREGANTLLKTLEEPPGHSVFVLISAAPESLLETVISRCRRVDVRTVPRGVIEAGLALRGVAPELALRAARESHGRPGKAIAFAKQPDLMDDRLRLLDRCARVAVQRASERISRVPSMVENWRQDRSVLLGELDAWEAYWESRLRFAAESGDRGDARDALRALDAVTLGRADLQANVQVRLTMELMLLSFPRVTLSAITSEEVPASHA